MNGSYYKKLEKRIDEVLKQSKFTFQEIVRECKGAYPLDVLGILGSAKYLQTREGVFLYENPEDSYVKEFVTEKIDNNPVLCSWYFSIDTCKKIADMYLWDNKKILFLGMPRLFEYFARNVKNAHFTLVDLDDYVVNKLKENDDYYKNHTIINADINDIGFEVKENFDFIFLDPPWYMEYYDRWIAQSYKILNKHGGILLFPLFQELTRPHAEEERKNLLGKLDESSTNYLVISDFIEYEIPTFEECELQNYGVALKSPWKRADLIVVKGVRDYKCERLDKRLDESKWHEIDIFHIRIFIDINEKARGENVKIRYIAEDRAYLKNPSRRNQELSLVNMLTSRGQGYVVESPEKLLLILKEITEKVEEGADIRGMIDSAIMDQLSKKILLEILGGKIC